MKTQPFGSIFSAVKKRFTGNGKDNISLLEKDICRPFTPAMEILRPNLVDERFYDIQRIKEGTCRFSVKYLGSKIVCDSRGAYICSGVIQSFQRKKNKLRGTLYICVDGFRFIKEGKYQEILIDQIIEGISYCSSDELFPYSVAFICIDDLTECFICYAFKVKDAKGERVSQAMDSAFRITKSTVGRDRRIRGQNRISCFEIFPNEDKYEQGDRIYDRLMSVAEPPRLPPRPKSTFIPFGFPLSLDSDSDLK
ncbi:hypothetical protein ACOME3_000843 [Neoechinorhynchus agilis]